MITVQIQFSSFAFNDYSSVSFRAPRIRVLMHKVLLKGGCQETKLTTMFAQTTMKKWNKRKGNERKKRCRSTNFPLADNYPFVAILASDRSAVVTGRGELHEVDVCMECCDCRVSELKVRFGSERQPDITILQRSWSLCHWGQRNIGINVTFHQVIVIHLYRSKSKYNIYIVNHCR